jgi:hypothetical protein
MKTFFATNTETQQRVELRYSKSIDENGETVYHIYKMNGQVLIHISQGLYKGPEGETLQALADPEAP